MAKIKAKTISRVKRTSPIALKAGSAMPRNIGGAINARVVATVRKKNG